MTDDNDALLDATTALVPPLLTALEALAFAGRHLHPPHLAENCRGAGTVRRTASRRTHSIRRARSGPTISQFFRSQLVASSDAALRALDGVAESATDPNGVMRAYRSMRQQHAGRRSAVSAVVHVAAGQPVFSRDRTGDRTTRWCVASPTPMRLRDNVGILNVRQRARRTRRIFVVRARVLRRIDALAADRCVARRQRPRRRFPVDAGCAKRARAAAF